RIAGAAPERGRNAIALLLRPAVADDDLLVGRARAGIVAIDGELGLARGRLVLGRSGRREQRDEEDQARHLSPVGRAFLNAALLFSSSAWGRRRRDRRARDAWGSGRASPSPPPPS